MLVTSVKAVLALCGSNKGGRFRTEEMVEARVLSADVEVRYGELDRAFKAIEPGEKKTKGKDLGCAEGILKVYREKQNDFLAAYGRLVSLVDKKRRELKDDPPPPFEVDPEAEMKLAQPLPSYLQSLIDKYEKETMPVKVSGSDRQNFAFYCIVNSPDSSNRNISVAYPRNHF